MMRLSSFWKKSKKESFNQSPEINPIFEAGEFKLVWARIHSGCVFRNGTKKEQQDFLRFIMEVVKQDLQGSFIAGGFYKEVYPESRLFPIPDDFNLNREEKYIKFDGNTVLIRTREIKKLFHSLSDILELGFRKDMYKGDGIYYPDLKLIFLRNGIHHAAIAKVLGDPNCGAKCEVYRIADFYPYMDIDANFNCWRFANGKTIPIIDHRFALLYALAKELCVGLSNVDVPLNVPY